MLAKLVPLFAATLVVSLAIAQSPALRFYQPAGADEAQLVDDQGVVVHSWPGQFNLSGHLLADGSLLRTTLTGANVIPVGGSTGRIQRLAFDGTVLWDYFLDGPFHFMHHDIEPLKNGHVLVIVWEKYDVVDAIAAGRDPALITGTDWMPDAIFEIEPTGPTTGTVVWEWHVADHLIQDFDPQQQNYGVVAQHPELVDVNYPPVQLSNGDWNHSNGIDYDPIHDWIILSPRAQDEIWIIDHSTTTAEAAGHTGGLRGKGGDLLYRWGNPAAYRAGTVADQQLFDQHDPQFIGPGHVGAGHVTVFNNNYILGAQSAVFELELPIDGGGNLVLDPVTGRYGPTAPFWMFTEPGFYSPIVSSAQRLPKGDTLICSGTQNRLFEVTAAGQTVWSYVDSTSLAIFQSHYVDRSLWADTAELSAAGGQIHFDHLRGSDFVGHNYLLLGSVTGTLPGTSVGGTVLPLAFDFMTQAMATSFNTGVFVNTIGTLDPVGGGSSSIVVPPGLIPTDLAGLRVHFAHLTFGAGFAAMRASNPVTITIAP